MENGRGNHYQYDAEGQLTDAWYEAVDPAGAYSDCQRQDHFAYDALGNRFGWDYVQNKGWMHFLRQDNGLNQYFSWENNYPGNDPQHWGTTTNYDNNINGWRDSQGHANGVLMQDGNITAGYNALNQPMLATSWPLAPNWMFFGYDPLGRCVKRWVAPSPSDGSLVPPAGSNPATYLYYDGWNLIQEGGSASDAQRQYVHGARVDEVLAQIKPATNEMRYFHYDASGNGTLQTDGGGNIAEQYEYDAFGYPYVYDGAGAPLQFYDNGWKCWRGYSPWGNRFLFTGREWLTDLKLYDYRNRMYQPELGRFMQPDPKEFGTGDYNLYRYCHNDPVNKSDPTGLITIIIPGLGPQRDRGGNWSNEIFIRRALERFKDGRVFSRDQMGAAKQAINAARAHGDKTLNIVGYSLGGAAGVKLAGDLGRSGIGVDRLVTVDIVRAPGFDSSSLPNPVVIPSNVKEAYNYYQQTGGFHPTNFKGTPVTGPSVIVNKEITPENEGGPVHHAWMPGFVFPDR